MQPRIPASLFVGLVIGAFGSIAAWFANWVVHRADHVDYTAVIRWEMFEYGCGIAGLLLVTAALFGLANRLAGGARIAMLIAAWLFVVQLGWSVGHHFIRMLEPGESYDTAIEVAWRAIGALYLAGTIAITIAVRAWTRSALTVVFAVLAILVAVFGGWLPYFGQWMFDTVWDDHPTLYGLYWVVRELVWNAALLVIVHGMIRDATPPLPDQRLAVTGFRHAAGALLGRVLAAIALATIGIGVVRSPGAIEMLGILGPAVIVVTSLVFAWSLLSVDRANVGVPRLRLVLGSAITAWSSGVQILQASRADNDLFEKSASSWTYLAPIAGVVGIILVLSAIHSFAVSIGNERLRLAAGSRATLFIVMTVISLGLPLFLMAGAPPPSSMLVVVVMAAICGIVAVVALAGLMAIAAESLGDTPQLPEARLRK